MNRRIILLIATFLLLGSVLFAQVGYATADLDGSFRNISAYPGISLEKEGYGLDFEINGIGEIFLAGEFLHGSMPGVSKYNKSGNLVNRLPLPFTPTQVKVLPSKELIAVGEIPIGAYPQSFNEVAIAKFDHNLNLDPNFGTNGIATTQLGINHSPISAVVQEDGMVVVGGSIFPANLPKKPFVYRFNSNGKLDSGFSGGTIYENIDGGVVTSLAMQGSNIVASGSYFVQGKSSGVFTTVYNAIGNKEQRFNNGNIIFGLGGSLAVQPKDYKIVIGNFNGFGGNLTITRLMWDGTIDSGFGLNGNAILPAAPTFSSFNNPIIALDLNGGIVVAASSRQNTSPSIVKTMVARFKGKGTLDTTFVSSFMQTVPPGSIVANFGAASQPIERPNDIAIQNDGRILVITDLRTPNGTVFHNGIARFNGN